MKVLLDLSWVLPFFDSNFFVALTTFLSVLTVIWIYKRQKIDEKTKAAKIISIEISDAESLLDNIKTSGINLANTRQVLPVNSWVSYKHLFANDLNESGLRLIDNFYSSCELINKELSELYCLPQFRQYKARVIAEKHALFSENSKDIKDYEAKKATLKFFEEDDYWWQPYAPKQQMVERVKLVQYISSTPIGDKLKEIAGY